MKKQRTSVITKFIVSAFFLIAVSATVRAQTSTSITPAKESPAVIKYLGMQEDMIVFNVSYKNPGGDRFSIIVKDQDGGQLYENSYKDKNFYKQFRLPKTDRNKVTFTIRNTKDADIAKTFEINVNTRYIEDIAVKKMD